MEKPLDVALPDLRTRTSAKWRYYDTDVLPMWVAEMDFPLAAPIAAALHEAIDRSDTGYRWLTGLPEALAQYAQRRWGFAVDLDSILVFPDVMGSIANALRVFTASTDAVVINPPVYHPFFTTVQDVSGRTLVEVPLIEEDGEYRIDFDAMALAFARPEVTAYLMSNPHNPTGTVFTADDLARVAALAGEHGILVLVDEIHAPLVLPGAEHVPYVSLGSDVVQDAFSFVSASKGWNIPGLKCAQVIASSPALARRMSDALPLEATFGTGHLGVIGSIAAYTDGGEWMGQVLQRLDHNRRSLTSLLAQHAPEVGYREPQASYLAWLDFRKTGVGADPAAALLERERLALNSGLAFGRQGSGFARLNFATSEAILTEAIERVGRLCR